MKHVGVFENNISKCPDIMRKWTTISPYRVPQVRCNKAKDYFSSVGSSCSSPGFPKYQTTYVFYMAMRGYSRAQQIPQSHGQWA